MSRVLIIDDEKSIRITLCEFLKNEGYEADSAPDAQTAYEMLKKNDYDVVVTDIIMPRVSGIELLSKIRKLSDTIQIIIMTGEPTVNTAIKAVQNGAYDYLTKPLNKQNLLETVRHAAEVKKLHDEKANLENQNLNYQKSLENIVEERTNALKNAMQGIIFLLSSVVEVRDPYTAGHQRRVGNLSSAIAKKLKMDDETCETLRIIGYIHDIGKIVIPSEILSKPGKLSHLEMQMIREHPQHGFDMLSKVKLPDSISNTIFQHHERINGSGYPNGIAANSIGDEAKILMVADVVEAMMSHRPYRPALGLEAALDEITVNSGKLYEPEIVNACKDLFCRDNYRMDDTEHSINFVL